MEVRNPEARLQVVTIDGPAGSGKSAVAERAARRLGCFHLDTGALYRTLTLLAVRQKADLEDESGLVSLLEKHRIEQQAGPEGPRTWLDGRDVEAEIRTPEITRLIHHVADKREVRRGINAIQRRIAAAQGHVVVEGRDSGSVVFPDARWRFYLDASPEVRARRRHAQWTRQGGVPPDFDRVLRELRERDRQDTERPVAPLVVPEGATVVDTTNLSLEQVVERIVGEIKGRQE